MSTSIYLLVLCIVDSGLLLLFLITDSLPTTFPAVMKTKAFSTFFSYIGFPLFYYFVVASIWLIVGVTLNRFTMVIFPVKSRRLCSVTRTCITITSILVFSFVVNIPHFFNYQPRADANGTYTHVETEFAKTGGAKHYEFWVHCMFLVLAPWASIALFNGGIIYSLAKQSSKMTQKQTSAAKKRQKRDRQMTIMLLSVTFSFLVLLAWQCITQCFYMLDYGKFTSQRRVVEKSFAAAKIGVVINSSINFFLYNITGSTFRKEFYRLFSPARTMCSSSQDPSKNTASKARTDSTAVNNTKL
eukprot:gene10844-11997_t